MTTLIHIVGQPGVGKSTLAAILVAGLKASGKTAMPLVESGLQLEHISKVETDHIRRFFTLDYAIAEHQEIPDTGVIKAGEMVITLERGV